MHGQTKGETTIHTRELVAKQETLPRLHEKTEKRATRGETEILPLGIVTGKQKMDQT